MTLYYLQQEDIPSAVNILAEAFQEDPLYVYLEPDDHKRQLLLPIFFKHYIKLMLPYSHLVADGPDLKAIALWYDDKKLDNAYSWYVRSFTAILGGLSMCRYISPWNYYNKLKDLLKMGSSWIGQYQAKEGWSSYIHLDMLVTKPKCRGHGHAHQLMNESLATFLPDHPASTIETHNIKNVAYYEKYGYKLIDTLTLPDAQLKQYCMIRKQKCL